MILLLPSQRTIEGRQVLSSVEVTGHRHSAVTDSSIGSGASNAAATEHILCCCSSGTSGTVQFQMMGFI